MPKENLFSLLFLPLNTFSCITVISVMVGDFNEYFLLNSSSISEKSAKKSSPNLRITFKLHLSRLFYIHWYVFKSQYPSFFVFMLLIMIVLAIIIIDFDTFCE